MNIHPIFKILFVWSEGKQDTGDSCSNESFFRLGRALSYKLNSFTFDEHPLSDGQFVSMFEKEGVVMRSPDPVLNTGKFAPSRDQTYMFLLFSFAMGYIGVVDRVMKALSDRFPWYFNGTDVQGTELQLLKGRMGGWFWQRWIGDFGLFVNSVIRCGYTPIWKHDAKPEETKFLKFIKYDPKKDCGDHKIHIAALACAHLMGPSYWSRKASEFYFRNCPTIEGYVGIAPVTMMRHYYREETGNTPLIAETWVIPLHYLNSLYK